MKRMHGSGQACGKARISPRCLECRVYKRGQDATARAQFRHRRFMRRLADARDQEALDRMTDEGGIYDEEI